jgi:hypothetical protein
MTTLVSRELIVGNDSTGLGSIVVLDGSLESLAQRIRLAQLTTKPAQEAHLRRPPDRISPHYGPSDAAGPEVFIALVSADIDGP